MNLKYLIQFLTVIYSFLFCLQEVLSCRFEENFANLTSGRTFYSMNKVDEPLKRIILIHGLLGDSDQFTDWGCMFTQYGYQVLTYDLLGHGRTEWKLSGFFSQSRFASQLNELLKEIGWVDQNNNVIKKFSLLGVSMGGLISVNYAITYPDHIKNLILMCPPGMMSKQDSPFLYKLSNSDFVHLVKNIHSSKKAFRCGLYCASKLGFIKLGKVSKSRKKQALNSYHQLFSTQVKSGGNGSLFDRYSDFEKLAEYEDKIKIIFFWGINDQTVPLSPAIEFLYQHFTHTPIVVFPKIKHIPIYPILSPALVTLDFLESNLTVGVPLNETKNINYFYDNEINIVKGLNFTYSGENVIVKYDPDLFADDYFDFNITNSS